MAPAQQHDDGMRPYIDDSATICHGQPGGAVERADPVTGEWPRAGPRRFAIVRDLTRHALQRRQQLGRVNRLLDEVLLAVGERWPRRRLRSRDGGRGEPADDDLPRINPPIGPSGLLQLKAGDRGQGQRPAIPVHCRRGDRPALGSGKTIKRCLYRAYITAGIAGSGTHRRFDANRAANLSADQPSAAQNGRMPRKGLEPSQPCDRWHLKPVRLPIPPPGHGGVPV